MAPDYGYFGTMGALLLFLLALFCQHKGGSYALIGATTCKA